MEGVTVDGAFPPLVTFEYPTDMTVLFDSHYLIECTLLGQHCTTEELSNARFFLKFILPNLLCVNFTNGGGRTSGVPIESEENDKYPLSYATQLNIPDFTRYIESFIPEGTVSSFVYFLNFFIVEFGKLVLQIAKVSLLWYQ